MSIELKQGLILKSADDEYVYNIYSYHPEEENLTVDILNRNLETIATRFWKVDDFKNQIECGTIIKFKDEEIIGGEVK